MQVSVYNIEGKETGEKINLPEEIFGLEPNEHSIYLDVKLILANQRQGTHKSKERAEISGSTKKLKKQKGTGSARYGSAKSPLFVGGGRVFGPRPRDYSFKLNKKLRKLARKSALSTKVLNNQLIIVEDFSFETPKTKAFNNIVKSFNNAGTNFLLVVPTVSKNLNLSARNLPKVKVSSAADLNTYDVMKASTLVITKSSINNITEVLN